MMFSRKKPYGLYEATETPKACPKCNSTISTISHVYFSGGVRWRTRTCELCNKEYKTQSVVIAK
jgi:hypothetical protein